jgi:protein-tyrosine phosphatase
LVDIHSHILPGVDDGAQSIDESVAMLRLAAAAGTTDIVATPHANSYFSFDEETIAKLVAQLSAETSGLIKIHVGCDFHLNFDNLSDALKNPVKYTVNNGRYLMVELPDLPSLPVMRTALGRLLAVQIIPVITHPERNGPLCANLRELEGWVRDGCLLQVTAQSFFGRFGPIAQRVTEALMNSDMVHFVASDAHDSLDRPPDLSAAYKLISEQWGSDRANALCLDYPTAVIMNEGIFAATPRPAKKTSRFAFWK